MFGRRREAEVRAELLDRALHSDDLTGFDHQIRSLVALHRGLQPAHFQSEERRAATKDRVLRAYRARNVETRSDAGSRDVKAPDDEVSYTSVTLEHPDLGTVSLTDVEPIDRERAVRAGELLADLHARLAAGTPRHSER